MNIHMNERGSALLISLCLLAMLTLIGIMAIQNTNTEIDLAYNKTHSDKAFYIAEAGAKRAFVDINNDNDWRGIQRRRFQRRRLFRLTHRFVDHFGPL